MYRWNDLNGDGRFEPGETGALVARAGWGQPVGSIDPTLHAPRTDEFTFGAEHWFGTTLRLHGAATIRRERGLAGAVNVGAPATSYVPSFILDQGEDYLGPTDDRLLADLQPPAVLVRAGPVGAHESRRRHGALRGLRDHRRGAGHARLVDRRGDGLPTRAGAASPGFTAFENDQGVIGDRFTDPNASPFESGAVFFDRSYVLKWSTRFDGGHELHAGVSARYQDGQPFTRLVVAPGLSQGPEVVQAYRVGRTRFSTR